MGDLRQLHAEEDLYETLWTRVKHVPRIFAVYLSENDVCWEQTCHSFGEDEGRMVEATS